MATSSVSRTHTAVEVRYTLPSSCPVNTIASPAHLTLQNDLSRERMPHQRFRHGQIQRTAGPAVTQAALCPILQCSCSVALCRPLTAAAIFAQLLCAESGSTHAP